MEFSFDKIKGFGAATFVSFLSGITTGLLFIYTYNKHLFLSLDLFRLTGLSIAVCLPVIGINASLSFVFLRQMIEYQKKERAYKNALNGKNANMKSEWVSAYEEYHFFMSLSILFGGLVSTILFIRLIYLGYLFKIGIAKAMHKISWYETSYIIFIFLTILFTESVLKRLRRQLIKKPDKDQNTDQEKE
jgi:hypothetical protein